VVVVQTASHSTSSQCRRQEKRTRHHTALTDKHMGRRQFDTFNKKKTNDKLLIFSTLSSHCWRSYSSITMEKNIMEQHEEHHKTLIRVRDEKVNAVLAHQVCSESSTTQGRGDCSHCPWPVCKAPARVHVWRLELLLTSTMGCSKLLARHAATVPRRTRSVATLFAATHKVPLR